MADAKPLDSFHLFSKLPPELRLRIWALNLPPARLIPIRCGSSPSPSSTKSSSTTSSPSSGCTSLAPVPANLHACVESRAHALATRYDPALAFARQTPRLLLDYASDVVYFPSDPAGEYMAAAAQFRTAMSLCAPAELARIQRLALHDEIFSSSFGSPYLSCDGADAGSSKYWSSAAVGQTVECLRLIRDRMPSVEELIFVLRYEHDASRLALQVQTALKDLQYEGDDWQPPQWSIMLEPQEG